jgi:hypothetical protein
VSAVRALAEAPLPGLGPALTGRPILEAVAAVRPALTPLEATGPTAF